MTAFNDWPIKKCLGLSVSLLLATWGLIGLGSLGLDIPVLRQAVAFIFLSFVPGLLLLRILRVHNVHLIESLLYSVGLSLAFVMVIGVIANFALPPLGISKPIALLPLLLIITLAFLLLCLLAYIRDKGFRLSNQGDSGASESIGQSFRAKPAPYLLAVLLPLLAILGTLIINAYRSNILIYALVFTIILIIVLVAFNTFIPTRVYPFMMFMMALALLYQTTLISEYLVGSDIHQERYWAWLVLENGYWNATAPFPINSCLSIVMLAPVYSLLLNMDIIWLFKIVYPFLFSLMPLALFRIFRLQIKPQYAFLAVAFFITMPMFTMDMVQLVRQQVSQLFFVLVILLMVERKLTLVQRAILVLIFGCGVVVSYYGLGTGYTIGYLTCGVLVLVFIKSRFGRAIWQWLIGKRNSLPADLAAPGAFNKRLLALIVCVGLTFMFGYYGTVSSGANLVGPQIFANIVKGVSNPVTQYISPPPPPPVFPAPLLSSPSSYIGTTTPTLEWHTSPGATSYRLQVSTDGGFSDLVIDEAGITDTHYHITSGLERPASYFWRVNAANAYEVSEWSPIWFFWTSSPLAESVLRTELPEIKLPGFVQSLITRVPMLNSLAREPLAQTALGLDFAAASPGGKVWRIFQYLVQLCLLIGFIRLVFRPETLGKFKAEYLSLAIVSVVILLGIFVLPTVSYGLGVTRIWQITLLLLSPLFIFGGEAIAQGTAKLARVFRKVCASPELGHNGLALLRFPVLVIMIPYFIFNSGLVFELSKSQTIHFIDMPYSIALSSHRLDITTVYTRQDIAAANWLSNMAGDDYHISCDAPLAFRDYWGDEEGFAGGRHASMSEIPADARDMTFPCYIYFRAWNADNRMLTFSTGYAARQSISFNDIPGLTQLVDSGSRIYNNGGAQVLVPSEKESR
jgi:uncharacterized membrane protein